MVLSSVTTEITTCQTISTEELAKNKFKTKLNLENNHAINDYIKPENLRLKINGKWLNLSKEFVSKHPGGSVINQYKNADATQIFHAFHDGSKKAYKELKFYESFKIPSNNIYDTTDLTKSKVLRIQTLLNLSPTKFEANVGNYDYSIEEETKIVENFEKLRTRIHTDGLMEKTPFFYARKFIEIFILFTCIFFLQHYGWYVLSAITLGLCWQQLGWLTHEFCHHQPFKNRKTNNILSVFFGNILQGFSREWWKDKHNIHHAATNIIDQDGDIDLSPFLALVPSDLQKYKKPLEKLILKIIPYQHLYFTLMIPLLRFSWTFQSILYVLSASKSYYKKDQTQALIERFGIAIHWSWVFLQLYFLPDTSTRFIYFFVSQLLGGLFIGLVVSYNHNSVEKFPENSKLLNNFAALHILTTRNMKPSRFVDWFWGGLNYQIEHHLFPTMPRPNLSKSSVLVKEFCVQNGLPYLVDDFITGYKESLKLLKNIAELQEINEIERKKL